MAESASSDSTGMMNKALARVLRKDAVELREIYKETGSVRKMREAKEAMLAEVYRMLVLNLGEPPEEFSRGVTRSRTNDDDDDDDEDKDEDKGDDDADDDDDKDEGRRRWLRRRAEVERDSNLSRPRNSTMSMSVWT